MSPLAQLIAESAAADRSARAERLLAEHLPGLAGEAAQRACALLEAQLAMQDRLAEEVRALNRALAAAPPVQVIGGRPGAWDRSQSGAAGSGNPALLQLADWPVAATGEALFRDHPHPLCLVDGRSWRFIDVNPAALDQYGWAREEFLARGLADLCPPAEAERLRRHVAGQGGTLPARSGVWLHRRGDGSELHVHLTARAVRLGEREAWLVSALDISGWLATASAREAALAALSRSEAQLHVAQTIAGVGSFEFEVGRGAVRCTPQLLALLGRGGSAPDCAWREFVARVDGADRAAMRQAARRVLRRAEPASVDLRYRAPDGRLRWLSCRAEPETDRNGRVVQIVGTLHDVTERRVAEAALMGLRDQLRELSALREHEIDRERKRIAGDLHDALGQMLSSVRLQIDMMTLRAGADSPLRAGLQRASELVEDTIDMTRSFSMHLRPPALDLGLVPALQWLADDFSLRAEVGCTLHAEPIVEALDEDRTIELFRIVQESLTNIVRHADARRVEVRLVQTSERLVLTVADDGRGFDLEEGRRKGHFGLFGMNERALRLGGELRIDSVPGEGTCVRVSLPLHAPEANPQGKRNSDPCPDCR